MRKFLKEQCPCCGKISLKKKLTFENSDLYICKNSCISSKPYIDTNSLYTPEYFKNYYEDETITIAQKEMLVKIIFFLKKYLSSLLFLPNRLFLFNKKSIKLFLHKHNLEIQEYFIEPEFTSIPAKFVKNNFLKSIIDNILRVKIPSFINKNNSLTLIARRMNHI